MNKKVSHYLFCVVCICLVISCTSEYNNIVTTEDSVISYNLEEDPIHRVIEKFIERNPIQGLSFLAKLLNKKAIDTEEFNKYETLLLAQLKKIMRQYYLGENYKKALLYLDAFNIYRDYKASISTSTEDAAKEELLLDYNLLLKNIIYQVYDNGNYPLVQKYLLALYNTDALILEDEKMRAIVSDMFSQFRFSHVYAVFCDASEIAISYKENWACEDTNKDTAIAKLLDSTFIVDIDKGFTTEGLTHEIGSGFFITKDGYALTNAHVIDSEVNSDYKGKSNMTVKLTQDNYSPRDARVVGYDPLVDIALIKVDDVEVSHVFSIKSSKDVVAGDEITVIGSPIGLINTVTSGIISSKERTGFSEVTDVGSIFQMDASVNPGNSGGPMLNTNSEVIGVVVAKILGVENINFAIPSDTVLSVLPKLFAGGKVSHSWLGLGGYITAQGFEVLYIVPDSGASYANIEIGDSIQSINGVPIDSVSNFQASMIDASIDTLYSIELLRDSKAHTILIGSSKREEEILFSHLSKNTLHHILPVLLGSSIEVIRYGNSPRYRVDKIYENSTGAFIGFSTGDIIEIKHLFYNEEGYISVGIRVIQQSRGFLEDVFSVVFLLSTENFL